MIFLLHKNDARKLIALFPEWLRPQATVAVGAVVASWAVFSVGRICWLRMSLAKKRKEKSAICKQSLQTLEDKVEAEGKLTDAGVEEILQLTFTELSAKLKAGDIKPSDALEAYQKKALKENKRINCLVEPIREAEPEALQCDMSSRDGLLYGIPVSLKDNMGLQGYDSCVGLARWIDRPFKEDAVVVQVLRKAGAIPFVKTNVPQTMISWETTNPVFGATKNPHDTSRGAGGSSGGEGALVAAGGSILGFGSDIGGSVRIPCALNGVCGIKPTENRISGKGIHPIQRGETSIKACVGPLARDVDTVVAAMKALLVPDMFELDPTVPHLTFNDQEYKSKKPLRIGYFINNGLMRAMPAMERGVLVAKTALEKMGHEVVPWEFPNLGERTMTLWGKIMFGDGGKTLLDATSWDAKDKSMAFLMLLLSVPNSIKTVLSLLLKPIMRPLGLMLANIRGSGSVSEWWKLNEDLLDFRQEVFDELKREKLDALLCPGVGCTALPFGDSEYASGAVSYTMLHNVLDIPAGSLPVTKVSSEDVENGNEYATPDLWHKTVKKGIKGSQGLPVNVQVACLPWQEERVLRLMKDIETGLTTA